MHGATVKIGDKDLKNYAASWNRLKGMVCHRDESEALRRFRIRVTRSWQGVEELGCDAWRTEQRIAPPFIRFCFSANCVCAGDVCFQISWKVSQNLVL